MKRETVVWIAGIIQILLGVIISLTFPTISLKATLFYSVGFLVDLFVGWNLREKN